MAAGKPMLAHLVGKRECKATSHIALLNSNATNIVACSAATAGRALSEISIGGLLGWMFGHPNPTGAWPSVAS